MARTVRFSETKGINYEMVYDTETHDEITSLYDLKKVANEIDLKRQEIEKSLEESIAYNKYLVKVLNEHVSQGMLTLDKLEGVSVLTKIKLFLKKCGE